MRLPVVTSRSALRHALGNDSLGFVATLGALHVGHQALIARSAIENQRTVVSIFVNPTQFQDPSDFARYPRDLERDVQFAAEAGADLIFAPAVNEIYPPGAATTVEVSGLAERWEGASRPGHFRGVATVVTILLSLVRPARAYFGEKDYQQLQIVKRLHLDLGLPGVIVGCSTIRDSDGLALSSRNARLSTDARRQAAVIPRSLAVMARLFQARERDVAALLAAGHAELRAAPDLAIDYLVVVDGATLEPLTTAAPGARVLFAGLIDGVRLIDNWELVPTAEAREEEPDDAGG